MTNLRGNNRVRFNDESGDKKYFTIVPNFVIDNSSAIDQSLYLQLKRVAGAGDVCFPSEKTLRKKLNIGWKTLKKSLQTLIDNKWIMEQGTLEVQTPGGPQHVKVYKIIDIWEKNTKTYTKGVSNQPTLFDERGLPECDKGSLKVIKGVSQSETKYNYKNKEHIAEEKLEAKKETVFCLQDEIKRLEDSPRRDLNVVALIFSSRKPDIRNKEQLHIAITRHLRAAKLVKEFADDQIIKALDYCQREYKDRWTGETLLKLLTK